MKFNKNLLDTDYVICEYQVDNSSTTGPDNEFFVIAESHDVNGNKAYSVWREVDQLAESDAVFFETLNEAKKYAKKEALI